MLSLVGVIELILKFTKLDVVLCVINIVTLIVKMTGKFLRLFRTVC